jgi:hypothetical protein
MFVRRCRSVQEPYALIVPRVLHVHEVYLQHTRYDHRQRTVKLALPCKVYTELSVCIKVNTKCACMRVRVRVFIVQGGVACMNARATFQVKRTPRPRYPYGRRHGPTIALPLAAWVHRCTFTPTCTSL